jgi:hypothetical protein
MGFTLYPAQDPSHVAYTVCKISKFCVLAFSVYYFFVFIVGVHMGLWWNSQTKRLSPFTNVKRFSRVDRVGWV